MLSRSQYVDKHNLSLNFKTIVKYINVGVGPKKNTNCGESSQVLHKVATKLGRGVRLSSQTKQLVENVRRFFEKEKECRSNINRQTVVKRTAEATGISERCAGHPQG